MHNAYGYLRAPWNVNKSPFVTRAHEFCNATIGYSLWPSCGMHWNLTFDPTYSTWYKWVWDAGYAPHGPMHDYIGGYVNCGNLRSELHNIMPIGAVDDFAKFMVVLPKSMYRAFLLTPPEYCSDDTPQSQCHTVCSTNPDDPGEVQEMMSIMMSLASHLSKTGVPVNVDWIASLDEFKARELVRVLCTTPFSPGEQLEAGSPIDVSFWPIHPTMDRLYQYKRLANDFKDTGWRNPDETMPFGIANQTTSYCDQGLTTMLDLEYGYANVTQCGGHHADDAALFFTYSQDDGSGLFTKMRLSNQELFSKMNPNDYRMAYVYDGFSWSHCDEDGYVFPRLSWAKEVY